MAAKAVLLIFVIILNFGATAILNFGNMTDTRTM
jgi:hypothetical protein